MLEIAKQPYEAGHIVGVIAALQESCPGEFKIGFVLFHGFARDLVAERYCHRATVFVEEALVSRLQVECQRIHRVLLGSRPDRLAGYVASDGGEHFEAQCSNRSLQKYDRDERKDEPQEPARRDVTRYHDISPQQAEQFAPKGARPLLQTYAFPINRTRIFVPWLIALEGRLV
ncbi:MAG: hypothetical protein KIT82_01215 [Bradyrhizobium sp.]|nr:hypothetical protein [Bradyrhizobium sp.]